MTLKEFLKNRILMYNPNNKTIYFQEENMYVYYFVDSFKKEYIPMTLYLSDPQLDDQVFYTTGYKNKVYCIQTKDIFI
jgi:hypothetical protein